MNYSDILVIISIILLIIFAIYLLNKVNIKEKYMETVNRANKDMLDLEKITKNIESEYKPVTIELTSYEQEQEDNAIISYEELLNNKDNGYSYDEGYKSDSDVSVKKLDLDKITSQVEQEDRKPEKIEVKLMSYEKEEAFLDALKKLQRELS
jgi:hypothetical protein